MAQTHRPSTVNRTKAQRETFSNDFDILVAIDPVNQSKSDQVPHEWLPPNKGYWCHCGKRWQHVKDKYGLRYSDQERIALNRLAETCF